MATRNHPGWRYAFLLVPLLGIGWYAGARPLPPQPSFQRAWWYWHHPFRLSKPELAALRGAGCDRLYVHAGNLSVKDGALRFTGRQRFETAAPCRMLAVVRVHPDAHELLLGAGGTLRLGGLLREDGLPESVSGVQLDADIPTGQLGAYARLLGDLRHHLPADWELSVTALPDWLRSRDYHRLASAVDEIAPQFYGNRWPEVGKQPPSLWETDRILEQVRRSAAGPARVWVGLPSYGRCIVLDPRGNPVGVRHDVDPAPLQWDRSWRGGQSRTRRVELAGGETLPVEDTLLLRAERDCEAGPLFAEAGSTLWFQWPRTAALQQVTAAIRELREPRIAGVCFFRWPAPGEPLGVLSSSGASSRPGLSLATTRQGDELLIHVTNTGIDAPLLPHGVTLEVFAAGAQVEADPAIEYRLGDLPCSPLRADRAVLQLPLLRPGARWEACRVRNARKVVARAAWRDDQDQARSTSLTVSAEDGAAGRHQERFGP